ncbi:MAG: GNAT family N-acetyltransferase [Bacteroidetes bacterium]|nr:GNAT family N-acetyltransferase [Bacteroidota bacterium]MBU1720974.1 GNAT family N-acetyltransferase [Bacteroidota bacterium]
MKINLVPVRPRDLETVREIYNQYVLNSTSTMRLQAMSKREIRTSILVNHPKYKSFLIMDNTQVCGYCYISPFRIRHAYERTAEITIFLKPEFTGKGIGKIAVLELERHAIESGIRVLIGNISSDNEPSIRLFEQCGYKKCAHYTEVAEKFGKLIDVVAVQKVIGVQVVGGDS